MMNMLLVQAVLALCLTRCLLAEEYWSESDRFAKNLNHFIDESIHRNELQIYMDSLDFKRKVTDGKYILDAMISKFIKKYSQTVSAVKELEAAIHRSYRPSWLSPITNLFSTILGGRLSCQLASKNFSENVWSGTACEIYSKTASYGATKLSEGFEEASQENIVKTPSLRRQYFSSNEGITTIFPSHHISNSYDYSRRPWNLQAMRQLPKQVVVLIDNSIIEQPSSFWMWNRNIKSIKSVLHAAKSFITKLNTQDQIALLYAFPEKTNEEKCVNCFRENFVSFSPQNKQLLNNFINEVKPSDANKMVTAINQAFAFFEREKEDQYQEFRGYRQIILISQKKLDLHIPAHELKQLITLKKQILQLNVDFQMIDVDVRDAVPQSLLDQKESSAEMGNDDDWPEGLNYLKDDVSETSTISTPSWSIAYADQWGLGPVVTASLPVFQDHRYVGVVAIDIPVNEFFDEPNLLMPNQYTYAFIVDNNGYVINHPLLHHQHDVDTMRVSITTLERDPEFHTVYESIKRGESGKTEFYSNKFTSHVQGGTSEAAKNEILTTFYWEKVPNTKFTIGLAFVAESYIDFSHQSSLPEGSFLYHRFDFSSPQTSCSHYNRFATMDKPSVYLAARSFAENYKSKLNELDLMDLTSYFTSSGKQPNFLKDGVKEEMLTSQHAQISWMNEENPFRNNIIWRHYTTLNGVFRIFPGIQLPEHYDPTTREWFTSTLTSTKEAMISTPYLDPASDQVVITIAQTIYKNSHYMTSSNVVNPVAGVTGMDVKQQYFQKQFLNWFPTCMGPHKRCYLLDQAGFIITTSAMPKNDPRIYFDMHPFIKFHLQHLEPEVSHELINKKILRRNRCLSRGKGCQKTNYHFDEFFYEHESSLKLSQQLLNVYITPVDKTNAFLLVVSDVSPSNTTHPCFCSVQNCTQDQLHNCDAMLAVGRNNFECEEGYKVSSENYPCVPTSFQKMENFENDWAHELPRCYNTTFVHVELPPDDSIYVYVEVILFLSMMGLLLFCANRLQKRSLRSRAQENDERFTDSTTNNSNDGCKENFDFDSSSEDDDKKYFEARSCFSNKKKKRKYRRTKTEVLGSSDCEALSPTECRADLAKMKEVNALSNQPQCIKKYEGLSKIAQLEMINKEIAEISERRRECLKNALQPMNIRSSSSKDVSQTSKRADLTEDFFLKVLDNDENGKQEEVLPSKFPKDNNASDLFEASAAKAAASIDTSREEDKFLSVPALSFLPTQAVLKEVQHAINDLCVKVEKQIKNSAITSKPNDVAVNNEKRAPKNAHKSLVDTKSTVQKIKPSKKENAASMPKKHTDNDKPCCSGLTPHPIHDNENKILLKKKLAKTSISDSALMQKCGVYAELGASFITEKFDENVFFKNVQTDEIFSSSENSSEQFTASNSKTSTSSFSTDTLDNVKRAQENAEKGIAAKVIGKEQKMSCYDMECLQNSLKRSALTVEDDAEIQFWRTERMKNYENLPPQAWKSLPHSDELDFDDSLESVPEEERYLITSFLNEQEQYAYMLFSMQEFDNESNSADSETSEKRINIYDGLHSMPLETIYEE